MKPVYSIDPDAPIMVARVTSALLARGERRNGDPLLWAEITSDRNGTHYGLPIGCRVEGMFSLNAAFDDFEIIPIDRAPASIRRAVQRRREQLSTHVR
jgi:hypothetical protein